MIYVGKCSNLENFQKQRPSELSFETASVGYTPLVILTLCEKHEGLGPEVDLRSPSPLCITVQIVEVIFIGKRGGMILADCPFD